MLMGAVAGDGAVAHPEPPLSLSRVRPAHPAVAAIQREARGGLGPQERRTSEGMRLPTLAFSSLLRWSLVVWPCWMAPWEKEGLVGAAVLCWEQGRWGTPGARRLFVGVSTLFMGCAATSKSRAGSSPWQGVRCGERVSACAGLLAPALLAVAKRWRVARAWADTGSLALGLSKGTCGFSAPGGFLLL